MVRLKSEAKWYWNVVRGVCICLVLLIHVTVPTNEAGTIFPEWYLIRKLTAFPVAVFFFMAGYFVHIEKIFEKSYIWSKIKRVLFAYLVFSCIYTVLNWLLGSAVNWHGVVANFFLGTSEVQMYFCIYLMEMIILLPLLRKTIIESGKRNIWLILILFISCIVAYIRLYLDVNTVLLKPFCFTFLIYYAVGIYFKGADDGYYHSTVLAFLRKTRVTWLELIVLGLLVLSCIEGALRFPNVQYGQTTLGNYPYALSVIALLYALYVKYMRGGILPGLRLLAWLGEQSFTIYLIHMLAMRPMIVLFDKVSLAYPWRQLILFVGTLGCCVIMILIKDKFFTKCLVGGKER